MIFFTCDGGRSADEVHSLINYRVERFSGGYLVALRQRFFDPPPHHDNIELPTPAAGA